MYSLSNAVPDALPPGPVMVDVAGFVLEPHEMERLRHPGVGGVILFARNFQDRAQLTDLCRAIHESRGGPLLIAVDHEGGRVQRFRSDGFTHLPPMRRLGELWDIDEQAALRAATAVGYVLAAELRSCGVDLSFAPVLDLDHGRSAVIGDRAFHSDPGAVSTLARSVAHGMLRAGMGACGKHFPGHGWAEADSHHAVPVDGRDDAAIRATDMLPYRLLDELVLPAIMPAHVIYPEVDSRPAGFSSRWIQQVLREELGFDGLVFSDDLTMEGAAVAGDMLARAEAALQAGCDMVLVCNRPDLADDLLERLTRSPGPELLRRLRSLMPETPFQNWDTLQACPRYRHARRIQSQVVS